MSFFGKKLEADAREYGERLARRIRKRPFAGSDSLVSGLKDLALGVTPAVLQGLIVELSHLLECKVFSARDARLRCEIYLAWRGDAKAAAVIATEMGRIALQDVQLSDDGEQRWQALGWCVHAAKLRRLSEDTDLFHFAAPSSEASIYKRHFQSAALSIDSEKRETAPKDQAGLEDEPAFEVIDDDVSAPEAAGHEGVVVFANIGNESTRTGKDVAREFRSVLGARLPLTPVPDLRNARVRLVDEFPYAVETVDAVLETLVGRDFVHFRPTVFIGSPGSGKTRFARRLAETLGAPYEIVPCGGISDSSPGGTPRQWSSGQPSLPVMAVQQLGNAGPVVILDEIEKTGNSRHNGRFHDVLLGLLEPESAARWMDPYLMAPCDLSHLSWLMTANEPDPIPRPLRDRIRFLRFPDPRAGDLIVLANRFVRARVEEQGLDPRWAAPLDGIEMGALASAWPGGSLRVLQRLVESVVDARGAPHVQ